MEPQIVKLTFFVLAFLVAGTVADGRHHQRKGRRFQGSRQLGQGWRAFRQGRQDANGLDASAPVSSYGAATAPFPPLDNAPVDDFATNDYATDDYGFTGDYDYETAVNSAAPLGPLGQYSTNGGNYGGANGRALGDSAVGGSGDNNLAMLEKAVPGVPEQDYPIYASVPETAFTCDGQVEGGYYADPAAQCQVFHICTADGFGGLAKYSFLCPNGTTFNQNYFICDWWFNFDCAEAEALYSRNDEIRAEQEANIGAVGTGDINSSTGGNTGAGFDDSIAYDDYDLGVTESTLNSYGVANTEAVPVFQDNALSPALGSYGSPATAEEERAARRFRDANEGAGQIRTALDLVDDSMADDQTINGNLQDHKDVKGDDSEVK